MRQTYKSENKKFKLNPDKVLQVAAELSVYVHGQNTYHGRTCGTLFGRGRTLDVLTAESEQPGIMVTCTLAKLILSEDGKKLTFETYKYENVFMDPKDLYTIADRYQIKEKTKKDEYDPITSMGWIL